MPSGVTACFSVCCNAHIWNLHRMCSNSPPNVGLSIPSDLSEKHIIMSIPVFLQVNLIAEVAFFWTLIVVNERIFQTPEKIKNCLLYFQIYVILQATNHYFWNISFLLKKLIMVFLMLQSVVFKTWPVSQIYPWKVKWIKNWTLFW